jgi:hypothetical protein
MTEAAWRSTSKSIAGQLLSAAITRISLPRFPGSFCNRAQLEESDFSQITGFD